MAAVAPCCDPVARRRSGLHAAACRDPWGFIADRVRALTVACPRPAGCGQPATQGCVTASGYPSPPHRVRIVVLRGGEPRRRDVRASHAQADILTAAVAAGGIYLLCGYNFHGVDRIRRSVRAMVDLGWFEFRESLAHEDRYEITNAGRNAHARYQEWMRGAS